MTTTTVRVPAAQPAGTPRTCTHWDGDAGHCGSQVGVRLYLQGHRCPIHAPPPPRAIPGHQSRRWPTCAGCGRPLDPAAVDGGHTAHPECEQPAT